MSKLTKILGFALKVPVIIAQAVGIVENVKNASGPEKKQAVLNSVYDAKLLLEFGIGRNLLDDGEVQQAIDAYLEAEVAAMKLRDVLQNIITRKGVDND